MLGWLSDWPGKETVKVTLHKQPAKQVQKDMRHGTGTISLAQYEARIDGKPVGRVFQTRSGSMNRYSGRMYGYETFRTTWAWEAEEGIGGGSELETRREAVEELTEHIEYERSEA